MQEIRQENARRAAAAAAAHVDSERLRRAIAELASFGGRADGGVARETLSEPDLQARRWLVERARALGCTVAIDDCGNLFFRRAGSADLPPVLTGSHADTQPVGGRLDGAYGVLAGLEAVAALNDAGARTVRPIEVVAWTNEEGCRFGPGCMGSSAFVDPGRLAEYRQSQDGEGTRFGAALERALAAMPDVPRRPMKTPLASYVELHIEQGPVLERAGVPLGVVTGIQSVRWYRVTVTGVPAHAGTTPMEARADAMAAAIEIGHRLQSEAARLAATQLRLTLGRWLVRPNSINTIPGAVEFTIDARCVDEGVLEGLEQFLRETVRSQAGRCSTQVDVLFRRAPTRFPRAVLEVVEEACSHAARRAGQPEPTEITSGAFHDAMYLADHCPAAMIFVPSRNGLSHNAAEDTTHEDLVLGARALAYAVTRLAGDAA